MCVFKVHRFPIHQSASILCISPLCGLLHFNLNKKNKKLPISQAFTHWNSHDSWWNDNWYQFSSVAQSCPTLWTHGLWHARHPCPSPTPRACWNSCPLSQWCHPTISSSVILFSSCPQSFPASGSFLMNPFFTSGGQSIGASASASVLPVNIQG